MNRKCEGKNETYEASMEESPRIRSFMRMRSARLGFPLTVGEEAAGEEEVQSAPDTVIWTDEIPSHTSDTSYRRSLLVKGRLAGTGRERGGGGGGRGGGGGNGRDEELCVGCRTGGPTIGTPPVGGLPDARPGSCWECGGASELLMYVEEMWTRALWSGSSSMTSSTSEAVLRCKEPVLLTPLELKLSIESELVALPMEGEREKVTVKSNIPIWILH